MSIVLTHEQQNKIKPNRVHKIGDEYYLTTKAPQTGAICASCAFSRMDIGVECCIEDSRKVICEILDDSTDRMVDTVFTKVTEEVANATPSIIIVTGGESENRIKDYSLNESDFDPTSELTKYKIVIRGNFASDIFGQITMDKEIYAKKEPVGKELRTLSEHILSQNNVYNNYYKDKPLISLITVCKKIDY